MFNKHDVAFHSISESIDTQSAMGRFFFTLLSSIAELERNVISERTKLALKHKRDKNEKCGGSIPFGSDLDSHTMTLVPNDKEKHTIHMMQNWKEQGLSLRAICDLLQQYGIKTKQGKDVWLPNTISRILKSCNT